jgi:anti-sigma factor RsiW
MTTADEPITDADLQAFVDDRLDDARRAAVEAWLATRPEDAERLAGYRRVGEELRTAFDPVLTEEVPRRLRDAGRAPRRWPRFAVAAGWMVLGAALGTVAGWQLHSTLRVTAPAAADAGQMARRAAVAHATYSPEVRHPVEVGADQEQHLVAWLSKRLGVKVRAPKLEEAGLSLVGGRLLPGETGPVAHFMYQSSNGRRLTMYVRAEASKNRETAFRYAREGNVGVFYWIDRDSGYALASADLSREELLRVATLVYKQLEP